MIVKIIYCLYKDSTRDVRSHIFLRLRQFPWASPSGTPSDEGVYLTIYPSSCPNTDTIIYMRVNASSLQFSSYIVQCRVLILMWVAWSVMPEVFRLRCIVFSVHSQLLNFIILKFNFPVLLNILGNIFPYCPVVGAIGRINSSNIDLKEGHCWSCNWECLYFDLSLDIQWNIAWALGKYLRLCPRDFPRTQVIFHCISLLSSQYRFSIHYSVLSVIGRHEYNACAWPVWPVELMASMALQSVATGHIGRLRTEPHGGGGLCSLAKIKQHRIRIICFLFCFMMLKKNKILWKIQFIISSFVNRSVVQAFRKFKWTTFGS